MRQDTRNKDLEIDDGGPDTLMSKIDSVEPHDLQIRKKVVRRAVEDGFFKTGVEVIENEEIDFEGTAQDAAKAFKEGQLSAQQIREILQKKLKDDRIFGFNDYEDFNKKYFKKELVAFEEFHKVRQLKYSRVKYQNRFQPPE